MIVWINFHKKGRKKTVNYFNTALPAFQYTFCTIYEKLIHAEKPLCHLLVPRQFSSLSLHPNRSNLAFLTKLLKV